MKYWKKNNGDCGTRDGKDIVPDSVDITKGEYDAFVATIPESEPIDDFVEYENVDTGEILRLRRIE